MRDALEDAGFETILDDRFPRLDETVWMPTHLPHWTTPERAAARYRTGPAGLQLRIDADQPAWLPEHEGSLRVSNLQSAHRDGQHRTDAAMRVVTPTPERRLLTPDGGLVEVRMSASPDPRCMVALWLIGLEDEPANAGELCVAEIFGGELDADGGFVGVGVKAHRDPRLTEDFAKVRVDADLREPHDYALLWEQDEVGFFIDGRLAHGSPQSPDYPMQLMLAIFEFEPDPAGDYPKTSAIERVRVATSGPAVR